MGRHKSLIDSSYNEILTEEISMIKDSSVVIKLKAIHASIEHSEALVSEIMDIDPSSLNRWKNNYKKFGVDGLKNKKRGHNPSKLTENQKDIIKHWILSSKDSNGKPVHWTLKRLIREISINFNISIGKTPLWLILKSIGLSLKKPRPEHHKSDVEKQASFKKNSRTH